MHPGEVGSGPAPDHLGKVGQLRAGARGPARFRRTSRALQAVLAAAAQYSASAAVAPTGTARLLAPPRPAGPARGAARPSIPFDTRIARARLACGSSAWPSSLQ